MSRKPALCCITSGPGATNGCELGHALEFVKDQYRHCKPILTLGAGQDLLEEAGVPTNGAKDWAIVNDTDAFVAALGKHRNWSRQVDPPDV